MRTIELQEVPGSLRISNVALQEQNPQQIKQEQNDQSTKKCLHKISFKKLIIFSLIVTSLTLIIIYEKQVHEFLESFIFWVQINSFNYIKLKENPAAGFFLMIVIFTVSTLCFIPGIILTLGAGFAFNMSYKNQYIAIPLASISVWIGAQIGSFIALLLGRYVFRESVANQIQKSPTFRAIDKALQHEGFKLIFLLRLSPLIPFNFFNYLMGATQIKSGSYILGGIGMIPGVILYVYIGTTICDITLLASNSPDQQGGLFKTITLIIGSVLSTILVICVSILAKRKVNQILSLEKNEQQKKENEENQILQQQQNEQVIDIQENQEEKEASVIIQVKENEKISDQDTVYISSLQNNIIIESKVIQIVSSSDQTDTKQRAGTPQ